MSIIFNSKENVFKLDTPNSTYALAITESGLVAHLYYGKYIPDVSLKFLLNEDKYPFKLQDNLREKIAYMEGTLFEYPCYGIGDFREPALSILDKNGCSTCDIRYQSYKIYDGKPKLKDMPSTFAKDTEASTLEIICVDEVANIQVTLCYTVFKNLDVITKNVTVTNLSTVCIYLNRALSSSVDFNHHDFNMITLNGAWARERHPQSVPLHYGKQSVESLRGETSHQSNPFIAFTSKDATETSGEIFGFNLVYSGNFLASAEVSQFGYTRVSMGINPTEFSWKLSKGDTFYTPEVVMVYSSNGLSKMSNTFHDLYRNHLIRGKFAHIRRPILINNWEATYFDFDTDKLLSIAEQSAKLGIEMLVMDDGWFGHRNDDSSSLGDWFVNETKIKGGLKHLVDRVNSLGLKFGIWIEPEMVSPDSELFREHPDWAIQVPNRPLTQSRCQYVLDFSRLDVRNYIYTQIKKVLSSANIEYVKWDMNRLLTEVSSAKLSADCQKETFHRYVLGVYDVMNRLTTDFPNILLENCSSGGARFDPAMLYYSPQIWTSDDTDAIERLAIQYGTSMCYPPSCMGSHVSDCPNHVLGRSVPFETRGHVAMVGTFGYELDVTKIPSEERQQIPSQVETFKRYSHILRDGDYFRLSNYFDSSQQNYYSWIFVSKDKTEALLTYVQIFSKPNVKCTRVKLIGLNESSYYKNSVNGQVLSGSALMNIGLDFENLWGDFKSVQIYFKQI